MPGMPVFVRLPSTRMWWSFGDDEQEARRLKRYRGRLTSSSRTVQSWEMWQKELLEVEKKISFMNPYAGRAGNVRKMPKGKSKGEDREP
jgi:hypothetical protein